jgi:nucleoside-diphosphate-sugar epimerase
LARALIVGCGCRGRELGTELADRGWQVRGTSRSRAGLDPIEAAGLEAAEADPDRPGTVLGLCGDVAIVVWLLASAEGDDELTSAIHGPRLERLLEKLVDSPVRGFAYEAVGSVGADQLAAGRETVERAEETWRIPVGFLSLDREQPRWSAAAADVVEGLVTG